MGKVAKTSKFMEDLNTFDDAMKSIKVMEEVENLVIPLNLQAYCTSVKTHITYKRNRNNCSGKTDRRK